MKLFVAYLDPYSGAQEIIHAHLKSVLDADIEKWARAQIGHFDRYRADMTREEVLALLGSASEASYFTGEIDVDTSKTYLTDMQAETAQIIWEAMLNQDRKQPGVNQAFDLTWENFGTYAMRSLARQLAIDIEAQWDAIDINVKDGITFDWELAPALLDRVEWGATVELASLPAGVVLEEVQKLQARHADKEWSGSPDPQDPDNFWIDDKTGERVNAHTGERTPS